MQTIEEYYNKFNEDKRLLRRHGQVEYIVSMKYIHKYLEGLDHPKILDVGAGTGAYSVPLANEGYDVTAIELVKSNLGVLKAKKSAAKAYQGNALDLSRFEENTFDLTLIFGPMYHLHGTEKKVKVLEEAKRVTKPNGIILVAYIMNEFCVLTYAFRENHIKEVQAKGMIDDTFHVHMPEDELYDYLRLEDIAEINKQAKMERIQIVSVDGAANYMRHILRDMDDETFEEFVKYQLAICEREDLMGASGHTLDILRNTKQGWNYGNKRVK